MKAGIAAFNHEKALVGTFSVIVQPVVEPMEHYTALLKVANTMNTVVTKSGAGMSAGPVMGTKMMPVPALEQLEREISGLLSNLTNIKMEGGEMIHA